MAPRWILHADLDAFYASVEQMDRPELRGKPVVVGGSPEGRGVVAAASYEARAFGVRSAMPMRSALRQCPQAVRIAPRFDRYQVISGQIMAIFQELTPLVEPLSLDEAYLDISLAVEGGRLAQEIAQGVKERVKTEVGLNITVGGANSKSMAKIASQVAKPNGLLVVGAGEEWAFLEALPVGMLWGVGPKTAQRLHGQDVTTIGELAQKPESWFRQLFGKVGPELRKRAWGEDDAPVTPSREVKSISQERTFAGDVEDRDLLLAALRPMAETVARRLRRHELQGRTVAVKLRLADFTTFTRQATLPAPTDAAQVILESAWTLLERELHPGRAFRLIGARVSNFSQVRQLTLFGETEPVTAPPGEADGIIP